ncbi:hypothetical protein [Henriciella aquimarina]|uniref:hypothetical protein n=1 Tax=Henriciella aquimarina TaxID=545261 RepID=UPI000A051126|nr:hypothetical protein [Henriciella aquimarina]
MLKKQVRWGADLGYSKPVKPIDPNVEEREHGLKGSLKEGELGFSRMMTRRVARKDARDGIPTSESLTENQWSEREQQIAEKAERVRRGLKTWMSATASSVRNFIHDCTPCELQPDQLREAIKAEESEYRHYEFDDSTDARAHHEATVVELESFKERFGNQLQKRTPDIKKNVEQAIAILIFIMIVEGCFNALLFKDAQSSGLLGGMMVAFGISAVNVLFGVTAGFVGLRNLNHPEKVMKVMGGLVATVCVACGLFVNFFVAHFRDAVELKLHEAMAGGSLAGFSMFDIPPSQVMGNMFPNVFALDSLVAIGLLLIGLTVFAIAVYEGYDRISDRFPGYGRVWRKERAAYERRQQVRNGVRDDLSDFFSRSRVWFETQQQRHMAAKREIEKAMNMLETRRDIAVEIAARAGDQERSLKVAYRQAHRRERNACRDKLGEQAAVPAYFDEIVTPNLPPFDTAKEREQANAAIKTIENNIQALNITREWMESHIQQVQRGLSSIEQRVGEHIQAIRDKRERQDQQKSA